MILMDDNLKEEQTPNKGGENRITKLRTKTIKLNVTTSHTCVLHALICPHCVLESVDHSESKQRCNYCE